MCVSCILANNKPCDGVTAQMPTVFKISFTHYSGHSGIRAVMRGYMDIHYNRCLIHPKCCTWLHPSGLRLSGTALHMKTIFSLVCRGTPDAFVLRLFSSCVKGLRTKTYLWRLEYTQWAYSQQLGPIGSHS